MTELAFGGRWREKKEICTVAMRLRGGKKGRDAN